MTYWQASALALWLLVGLNLLLTVALARRLRELQQQGLRGVSAELDLGRSAGDRVPPLTRLGEHKDITLPDPLSSLSAIGFFLPGCDGCRPAWSEYQAVYSQNWEAGRLEFFSVVLGGRDDGSQFLADKKEFGSIITGEDSNMFVEVYGLPTLPSFYLISSTGEVIHVARHASELETAALHHLANETVVESASLGDD